MALDLAWGKEQRPRKVAVASCTTYTREDLAKLGRHALANQDL